LTFSTRNATVEGGPAHFDFAMSRRRRSKLQHQAGKSGSDAGVDPRQFFDRGARRRVDRKAYQLCRQVSDTLNFVLSGDTGDDVLRGLYVDSVDPAPDSSRLLVSVAPLDRDDQTPAHVYLTKLMAVSGKLRSEVAASISRRKTPELAFRVIPPPEPLLEQGTEHGDDYDYGDEDEPADQESE
jgi:ribosome-binding factor A